MKRVKFAVKASFLGVILPLFCLAYAVGQTGSTDNVTLQIENLKDPSWQTRWAAVSALGDAGDPRAVEPVAAIMNKDENSYVRATAALVLGDLKDKRGVDPLIEALSDESGGVRKNAAFALKRITGQNFGIDPAKWQEWWEKNRAK